MKKEWKRLLLAHAEVVLKYLLKIGTTKEDAEDVVQEAIIKTIECLSTIQPENLRAWLFKVALNRYYTVYNNQKRTTSLGKDGLALNDIVIYGAVVTGSKETLASLENLEFIKASLVGVITDKY